MTRPSFNLKALAADTETVQDDNWMISYIDVFVLMTTIFVMLLVLTRPDQASMLSGTVSNKSELIKPEPSKSELSITAGENMLAINEADISIDQTVSSVATGDTSVSELIDLTGDKLPKELQELVGSALVSSNNALSNRVIANHQWLDNIKKSIDQNKLNEQIQLQAMDEFTSLEIQSRVLFKSGASELSLSGEALLEKLVPVLKSSEGLVFIEGHTDDRPIMSKEFPSNWDLASARATEVLQFFVAEGLPKKRFRSVSYGDTKPLVPNDSEENRRKNRRVSLMIQGPR